MGLKGLSKVQLGGETTPGTAVAADTIWRGPFGGLKDARETVSVEEDIGVAMKSSRKYSAKLLAEMSFPATPLTPEQAPHVMEAGIKAVGTGVADGTASSGYVYEYPFGLTSVNTVKTYTIETGDDVQAEEAEYAECRSFSIGAVKGEAVQLNSEWFGRQVSTATFTPALSAPSVSEIHASGGNLYIDDTSGSFGGTQVSCGNLLEANLSIVTGRVPQFTADCGQLYFASSYFNVDEFDASLELKFLHKADAVAEIAKWRANTNRLVRLEFVGEAYATPGSGTVLNGYKGIQIDFPGSWMEFSALEHEDGQTIVTGTLTGGYDADSGEILTIRLMNELSAIP